MINILHLLSNEPNTAPATCAHCEPALIFEENRAPAADLPILVLSRDNPLEDISSASISLIKKVHTSSLLEVIL